jgi:cytochrome c-type biogenesis protein CcmF
MNEIGYFALCLALVSAAYATGASVIGIRRNHLPLVRSGENAALAVCGLLTVAVMALWYALFSHDFSVQYVAENSNRAMPLTYVVSALWGGQNGSLLFWSWVLALYTTAVVLTNRHRYRELMPYVVATLTVGSFFFALLSLFAADPFKTLPFTPPDGRGLNPLLQHPYMAIHPPVLYAGMVGMSVPFAFGIAALLSRRLDTTWLQAARRWILIPWTFLGAGLLLGGKWAYVELGWGGYWAWDPVENASFMPWLAATAFLHSIMIQERKGMLKVWNMVLVFLTYGLTIFGTTLTRSGIVESVHAFAESNVGPFFTTYLTLVMVTAVGLLVWRLPDLKAENKLESFASRETAFLLNNWILLGMLFAVLWGTLFPVISEAFTQRKITVGPPFFNQINVPIGLVLLFLTGAGPLFAWRRTSTESLRKNFAVPLAVALPVGVVLLAWGVDDLYAVASFSLCAFVLGSIAIEFHRGATARRRNADESYPLALYRLLSKSRRRYGGYLVHLSMVLLFVGFTGKAFTTEDEFVLGYGQSHQVGPYTFTYRTMAQSDDANKTVVATVVDLQRDGEFLATMLPSRHFYKSGEQQSTTEVSIYSLLREDIYLVFIGSGENELADTAKFQLYINPLILWVWIGGIVFVLGSLWTMWPTARDRRLAQADRQSTGQARRSTEIHA